MHMQDSNTIFKTLVGEKWSLYPTQINLQTFVSGYCVISKRLSECIMDIGYQYSIDV